MWQVMKKSDKDGMEIKSMHLTKKSIKMILLLFKRLLNFYLEMLNKVKSVNMLD